MTARTFQNKRYFGMVIADQALSRGKSLDKCKHVQAMRQHFVEGLDWSQTEYSKLYEKRYRKVEGCGGKNGSFNIFARKKLKKYDEIFEDIRSSGYKQSDSIEENIEVALDSSGEVLLIDGRHRLILAQLIGLKKIPVVVNLIAESLAKTFVENSENLKRQLQSHRNTETDRQTDRQRERERERERKTERHGQRERQTDTHTDREGE